MFQLHGQRQSAVIWSTLLTLFLLGSGCTTTTNTPIVPLTLDNPVQVRSETISLTVGKNRRNGQSVQITELFLPIAVTVLNTGTQPLCGGVATASLNDATGASTSAVFPESVVSRLIGPLAFLHSQDTLVRSSQVSFTAAPAFRAGLSQALLNTEEFGFTPIPVWSPGGFSGGFSSGFGTGSGSGFGGGIGSGAGSGFGSGVNSGFGNAFSPGFGSGVSPGFGSGYGPNFGSGFGNPFSPGFGSGVSPGFGGGYGPGFGSGFGNIFGPGFGGGFSPGFGSGYGPGFGGGFGPDPFWGGGFPSPFYGPYPSPFYSPWPPFGRFPYSRRLPPVEATPEQRREETKGPLLREIFSVAFASRPLATQEERSGFLFFPLPPQDGGTQTLAWDWYDCTTKALVAHLTVPITMDLRQ
ncbi:MAG: hypothetical protein FJ147_13090 [Deltaproteobacteria bacterium]|nr:hypothetical protein [Deltaproteobacteria bacterium]